MPTLCGHRSSHKTLLKNTTMYNLDRVKKIQMQERKLRGYAVNSLKRRVFSTCNMKIMVNAKMKIVKVTNELSNTNNEGYRTFYRNFERRESPARNERVKIIHNVCCLFSLLNITSAVRHFVVDKNLFYFST